MSEESSRAWADSDSWLFAAFADCGDGPVTLVDMLSTADAIMHAIPGEAEVEGAVRRLSAAGLLRVTQDGFLVTPRGRELRERAQARAWLDQVAQLRAELQRLPCPPELPEWRLPAGELERAYKRYDRAFWTTAERLPKAAGGRTRSRRLRRHAWRN